MAERIYKDDSAPLEAALYDSDTGVAIQASTVTWNFINPDGSDITVTSVPSSPVDGQKILLLNALTINSILYQPLSVLQYNLAGLSWSQVGTATSTIGSDGVAHFVLPGVLTATTGLYRGRAQFQLSDGTFRSQPIAFEVMDALGDRPNLTGSPLAVEHAWMKFEDLYDSTFGGPYLRDRTKAMMDKDKMARFLPDALYAINNVYQPATNYDATTFDYTNHMPLLAQGLVVETIYHLMRSYTEQPNPIGSATIGYFDRRDYLQRWQGLLAGEEQKFMTWLDLFKKGQMNFGQTATLVGGYGNSWGMYPRYMRGRFPYVYRW